MSTGFSMPSVRSTVASTSPCSAIEMLRRGRGELPYPGMSSRCTTPRFASSSASGSK